MAALFCQKKSLLSLRKRNSKSIQLATSMLMLQRLEQQKASFIYMLASIELQSLPMLSFINAKLR
jgi:hypothetical protein